MVLAIVNGLLTSIILETIILLKQMDFYKAVKTALGMSFISMIAMEISMNITDLIINDDLELESNEILKINLSNVIGGALVFYF